MRKLTKLQLYGLQTVQRGVPGEIEAVHGNTLNSLHQLRLIRLDEYGDWVMGIRGELILAGWTLEGLAMLERQG